jgi:hypothetical protein
MIDAMLHILAKDPGEKPEAEAKMTDPDSRQPISASVARSAAELVTRNQWDPLKSIFSAAQLKLVDKWISTTDSTLDRSEAIRRLVEIGLKAKGK